MPRSKGVETHRKLRELRQNQESAEAAQTALGEIRKLADGMRAESEELRRSIVLLTTKYETLQTSIVKTLTFLFALLDDPDAKAHAAAVVKDFQINKGSTYIPK